MSKEYLLTEHPNDVIAKDNEYRYSIEINQQSGSSQIRDLMYSTIPPVIHEYNFNKSYHRKVNDVILCIAEHMSTNMCDKCIYELSTEKGYIGDITIVITKDHDESRHINVHYKNANFTIIFELICGSEYVNFKCFFNLFLASLLTVYNEEVLYERNDDTDVKFEVTMKNDTYVIRMPNKGSESTEFTFHAKYNTDEFIENYVKLLTDHYNGKPILIKTINDTVGINEHDITKKNQPKTLYTIAMMDIYKYPDEFKLEQVGGCYKSFSEAFSARTKILKDKVIELHKNTDINSNFYYIMNDKIYSNNDEVVILTIINEITV